MSSPSSTRTVKAISEVEAFTLSAEDLKFVVSKLRRHTFKFYSQQLQTWAACVIQAAWHRYKRMKQAAKVQDRHQSLIPPPVSFWKKYGEKLVQSTRNNRFTMHTGLNSRVSSTFDTKAGRKMCRGLKKNSQMVISYKTPPSNYHGFPIKPG